MRFSVDFRSRVLLPGSLLVFLIPTGSCILRPHKQAAVPPPPKPAVVQDATPDVPLSVPQTAVLLPSEQELNPGAIPPPSPPPPAASQTPEAEAPPAQHPPRHPAAPVQPRTDSAPEEAAPPPPAPMPEEKPPFQPILSPDEKKRLQESVDARMREIEGLLSRVKGQLSEHDQSNVERIRSFVNLAREAARGGDYTQANDLTDRALILAKELNIE